MSRCSRRCFVLGLLALFAAIVFAVGAAPNSAPVAAGTPAPDDAPDLSSPVKAGPVYNENQKRGSSSWRSPELDRGRGQRRVEDDDLDPEQDPRLYGPRGATHSHPDGGSALEYDAAPTCGADCWADTVIRGYAAATSVNHGESIQFFVSTAQPTYTIEVYRMGFYGGAGATLISSIANVAGQNQAVPAPDAQTGAVAASWQVSYTLQTAASWVSGVYLAKLIAADGSVGYINFVVRDDSSAAPLLYVLPVTTYQAYNNWGGKSMYAFNSDGLPAVKASFDRPYSDWSGAGDFFDGDYGMIRWLEAQSYNVTYATSLDLHTNPALFNGHKAFVSPWHDEYWSTPMRDNLLAARDKGTHLAFFDANSIYWQIRFEANASGAANRVIVCYRSSLLDPLAQTTPALTTVEWRQAPVSKPEDAILGAMYSSYFADTTPNQPWVVANANHWIYSGTGLANGQKVAGLVGYEYDKLFSNGLTPANLTTLSSSPVKDINNSPDVQNTTIYTACSGAYVFNAATISWAWKLDKNEYQTAAVDTHIQKLTANLLNAMINTAPTPPAGCGGTPTPTPTATPGKLTVYDDALQAPWLDQSWGGVVNYALGSPVHGGTKAISYTVTSAWGALSFYDSFLLNTAPFTSLQLWARASKAGQAYTLGLLDQNNQLLPGVSLATFGGPPSTTAWKRYAVPIGALNPGNVAIAGVYLQDGLGKAQSALYLDDVKFDNTPLSTPTPTPDTPGKLTVYDNHLAPGWADASWGATVDYFGPTPTHSAPDAVALTVTSAWGALYPYTATPLDLTPFTVLTFWARGSQANQSYGVSLVDPTNTLIKLVSLSAYGGPPPAGAWKQYTLPLSDLGGVGKTIKGFVLQDGLGAAQPALYVDDIKFDNPVLPTPTPSPSPTPSPTPNTSGNLTVYDNHLAAGWTDASWITTTNLSVASPVHGGSAAIGRGVVPHQGFRGGNGGHALAGRPIAHRSDDRYEGEKVCASDDARSHRKPLRAGSGAVRREQDREASERT